MYSISILVEEGSGSGPMVRCWQVHNWHSEVAVAALQGLAKQGKISADVVAQAWPGMQADSVSGTVMPGHCRN